MSEYHHCTQNTPTSAHGAAVTDCVEAPEVPDVKTGTLWIGNGEFANQVNYCPFCGYKAKAQLKEQKPQEWHHSPWDLFSRYR